MTRIKTFIWTLLSSAAVVIFAWGYNPTFFGALHAHAAIPTPEDAFYAYLNNFMSGGPYLLLAKIVGALLIIISLLLLIRRSGDKATGSIILKKAKGNVEIKLASVQECLIRAACRDEDVKSAKVSFSGKGKDMKIRVSTCICEMPDVPAKTEQLQFMLENRFKELMGPLSDDIRIDVVLKKIAARKDDHHSGEALASARQNSDRVETVEIHHETS